MDHNLCRENLSAYLDGELPAQEKALVEAHLADCPDCRAMLGQLGTVSGIFKKHAMEPVPLSLKGEVLGGRVKTAYPWFKPVLALATAAACLLVVMNLTAPDKDVLMQPGFSARGGGDMSAMESSPAGEAGQAAPSEEVSAPAAPSASPENFRRLSKELSAESDKKSGSQSAAASVRGSYGQAKFAASRALGSLTAGGAGAGASSNMAAVAGAKAEAAGNYVRGDRNHISVSCKDLNTGLERPEVKLSPSMKAALDKFSPAFRLRGLEEYSSRVLEHFCYSPNSSPSAALGDFNGDGRIDAHLIGYENGWLLRVMLLSSSAGSYEAVSLGKYKYDGLEAAVKQCSWCYDKEKKLRNAYYLQPKGTTYMCGGDYWVKQTLENDGIALLDIWEKGLYINYVSIWDPASGKFIEQHCVLNPCSEYECR